MRPFFSLLIPTKNRSHIIGDAIRNLLRQSFEDYEVVVMDNDDDERATADVVKSMNDPRIRYFRSGGLLMADNWEAALKEARGEYVMFMQDKQFVYPHAFETIHNAIEKEKATVVQWYVDALNNTNGSACVFSNLHGKTQPEMQYDSSLDLLKMLMDTGHYGTLFRLPKGFNSATHHSVIEKIRSGPAGRVCFPVAPDYTMGYAQLACVDQVLTINQALSAIAWAGGNGTSYSLKSKQGPANTFIKQVGAENIYDRVPVRTPLLVTNMVYNDFLNVRDWVGGNLTKVPFDMVAYFAACMDDLVWREKLGVDMSDEQKAWDDAFEQQPPDVQKAIRVAIKKHERERAEYRRSQLLRKMGVARVIYKIQHTMGKDLSARPISPTFPSVFDAVDWAEVADYKGTLAAKIRFF
jgi:hypothetical protein